MKKAEPKDRIKEALEIREMRQSELVERTGIDKGQMSSYLTGRYKPKQNNLHAIAEALSVDEAWLMGYDVPMKRPPETEYTQYANINTIAFEITGRSLQYSPQIFGAICRNLDSLLENRSDKRFNSTHGRLNINNILNDSTISYDDKALAIRSIIDMALFDPTKNKIQFFYTLDGDSLEIQMDNLINTAKKLNLAGLNKAVDYVTDLSSMNNYSQNSNGEKVTSLPSTVDSSYLKVKAAHERTDIEVSDKMRKHDDDIMNDEDFWR